MVTEGKTDLVRDTSLTFVRPNIIEEAKRYLSAVNLPPEALPAVVNAAISAVALRKQIRDELRLPTDKKKHLVGVPPGIVLTESRLVDCVMFSKANSFPLSTIYIAKQGQIAVKAVGWRTRCQSDPRIFKGFQIDPLEVTVQANNTVVYRKSGQLVFWTGETFPAEGLASTDEPRGERTPLSHLAMIAETRMQTRAIRLALGLPFDVAEDIIAGESVGQVSQVSVLLEGKDEHIVGLADFLARCNAILGLRRKNILATLKLERLEDISNLDEAYQTLKQTVQK